MLKVTFNMVSGHSYDTVMAKEQYERLIEALREEPFVEITDSQIKVVLITKNIESIKTWG